LLLVLVFFVLWAYCSRPVFSSRLLSLNPDPETRMRRTLTGFAKAVGLTLVLAVPVFLALHLDRVAETVVGILDA
jgi:hypothetical protein